MKYYIGLDNGGTTTKAAIFDINGKSRAWAYAATAKGCISGAWMTGR